MKDRGNDAEYPGGEMPDNVPLQSSSRRLRRTVTVLVFVAATFHIIGRLGYRYELIELYLADTCTFLSFALLFGVVARLMSRGYRASFLSYLAFAAAVFMFLGQGLNVFEHLPFSGKWNDPAIMGPSASVKDVLLLIGVALIISVAFLSLIESNRIRMLLADAYADVEHKVLERTSSLQETNRRLEDEIRVRQRAEESLRLSEEKFRAVVENSADAILRVDTAMSVLYANPMARKLLQGTSGYLAGKSVSTVLGPNAQKWLDAAENVLKNGRSIRIELELVTEKQVRILDWILAPEFSSDGEVASLLTVARDITELLRQEAERRTLQDQLTQAQKLESVGRLAGGVAHDFNNLLQVILGYLDLAMAELDTGSSIHSKLSQVARASERATRLVRQLLAFSRSDKMKREYLDLNKLVIELTRMLQRMMGERHELRLNISGSLPTVYADAGHVEQVLMNLCVNARDAMPSGGSISIETKAVRLNEEDVKGHAECVPGDYVVIKISDSGIGMTHETMENIFDPFFTTKEVGKGTGLGLATVYGIVKQHGGFIRVESQIGIGSVFFVFLPVSKDKTADTAKEPEIDPIALAGKGETILVAEDDEPVRLLTVETLKNAGYRVIVARDGREAMDLAASRGDEIHLYVLDAIMPWHNGREVLEQIILTRPTVKVLFVTGYSFSTLDQEALPTGSYEVLQKPIGANVLLSKVRAMLDNKTLENKSISEKLPKRPI